jgi:hypothetical protein
MFLDGSGGPIHSETFEDWNATLPQFQKHGYTFEVASVMM